MTEFISLHNQTSYSLLDSLIEPKALFKRAKELGQSAIAITDHGSIGAAWDAWKASKETGVKLIIGCECYFQDDAANVHEKFRHVILIAKNAIGYRNLLTLNKKGFDQNSFVGKRVYSVLDWKLLEQYSEGLVCLTACGNGIISQLLMNHKMNEAEDALLRLQKIFGENLGIEVQPNNMKRGSNIFNDEIDQFFLNRQLINMGKKHNIRVVAACNTHYLTKEEHETHDVFLAIGAHQPVFSNYRLRYPVPEFYLKTGDEVKAFFTRNYGEELAQQLCDNSIYFANLCETPEWIDPKYSNPSGKELPIFPVKDEPNYAEFRLWVKDQPEEIAALEEDKLYLRYLCKMRFDSRVRGITSEQRVQYDKRIDEELDVLEFHGFSSYMLIVYDFIEWARKNEIAVGEGRGCLTGETQVLTANGFQKLDSIKIGDKVYSHTGNLKRVLNIFQFDVEKEKLLQFKMENAFGSLSMTQDHKVFACKKTTQNVNKIYHYGNKTVNYHHDKIIFTEPNWISAQDLTIGDYIYTTFPISNKKDYNLTFDMEKYCDHNQIVNNKIEVKNNIINDFSIREISRKTNIAFGTVRKLKNKQVINQLHSDIITNYLNDKNCSLSEWQNKPKYNIYYVNRYLELDDKLLYVLGRWVGDGSIRDCNKNGINIAFNRNEVSDIEIIKNYFNKLGIHCYGNQARGNGFSLDIGRTFLSKLFLDIFPDYKSSSYTKHLPSFFRELSKRQLQILLQGVFDSDGCQQKYSNSIKTTSLRLAQELKESFDILGTVCGVFVEKASSSCNRNNAVSYKLRFNDSSKNIFGNGYYSKISKIETVRFKYVYDITVEEDHSYLTASGVVHNSVGGSLIAYLLGIHQADPIKYSLIFARFHNKDKLSFPDIDVDFSPSGREKVQNYLREKYGADNVAHVSNVNTITPKVYARDIARACELGGSKEEAVKIGNDVADCIPAEIHSIEEALTKVPLFAEYAKRYPALEKFKDICGKYRAWSTHAGGIIISARALTGLVPLRKDKDGVLAIEYDKDKAEENGLVKMDTLGLSTLDIIDQTMQLIKTSGKSLPPVINYDDYDKEAYDTISAGDTFCVFQLGTSGGTIDLCRRIKPQSINDISYINSLARPSARDMRNDFILTKDGKKPFALLHPNLGRAFNNTFGFGLYEESLMYLAQDVAGWSLHSADRLRKLTKEKGKNPKKAQEWRTEFIKDAVNNNINEAIAKRIWDEVVDKFQGYGFNMSHSVLYSMISYKTAYLKAHYPIEFLIANLMAEVKSNTPDAKVNIEKIKKELRKHHVKIIPPDINKSKLFYIIEDSDRLITGLDAIKFVGDDAIKDIIAKRPFKDFFDFMLRVSSKTVRSNSIQALAACGALDSFKISRKLLFLYCSDFRKKLQVWLKKHDLNVDKFIYPWPTETDWTVQELYALEQYYLGESFICKPAIAYGNFFKDDHITVNEIKKSKDKSNISSIKGIVRDFFEFKVKKETSKYYGMSMVKAVIEDKNGEQCVLTIFPDRWQTVSKRIEELNKKIEFDVGIALHFSGNTNNYEDNMGIILDQLFNIALPPFLPPDLKAKKINLKEAKAKLTTFEELTKPKDIKEIVNRIEDILYDEGLIDLDEESTDD